MVDMAELVTADRVFLNLRARSKRQVLQELAQASAQHLKLDPSLVYEALMRRERLGTTGVGDGIAIPHARVPGLDRIVGFFARLTPPVEFEALDERDIDLVFLLLAPEDTAADHLKALARVARTLRDPLLCARLRQERDPLGVLGLLTQRRERDAA